MFQPHGNPGKWLADLDLGESDLRCGAHEPYDKTERDRLIRAYESPCQLHNNCSGKHSGFLTVMRHLKAGPEYVELDHPLQVAIKATTEEVTGETLRHPYYPDYVDESNLYLAGDVQDDGAGLRDVRHGPARRRTPLPPLGGMTPRPGRPRPRERPRNHLRLHARHTDFAVEVPPPDQGRHPQRHPLPPGTREQGQK